MARVNGLRQQAMDVLLAEPSSSELSAYPHVFRPLSATRFARWEYAKQGVGGVEYELNLWTWRVPAHHVAVINRFGAYNSVGSNYTLLIDGEADPIISDVGENTFAITGGVPGAVTLTYKNFFWDVADAETTRPIRASFLIDPVIVRENQTVVMYAKTKDASGEMAAGVSGYFYKGYSHITGT